MTWEADFDDLMKSTVTVQHFTGYDNYGASAFGAAVSYKARIVYEPKRVLAQNGQEAISSVQVWISGSTSPSMNVKDQITLPNGTQPVILRLDQVYDESGTEHHTKVHA